MTVDGLESDAWTYDATANAVVFADETAPVTGSTVVVSYLAAVPCHDS